MATRNLSREGSYALHNPARFAGKMQEKAKVCASAEEADLFLESLPKKAHREGLITKAYGADGSVAVSATWTSGEYDPGVYKGHPAWDAIDRRLLAAGDPDVRNAINGRYRGRAIIERLVGVA